HREIRAAAADGEAGQQIGSELIVETACQPTCAVGEAGATDPGFAIELGGAVEAGEPGPPARLVGCRRVDRLEGGMVRRLRLLRRRILQGIGAEGDAVDVETLAAAPERALVHHDRGEHVAGEERGLLRAADALAGERIHGGGSWLAGTPNKAGSVP